MNNLDYSSSDESDTDIKTQYTLKKESGVAPHVKCADSSKENASKTDFFNLGYSTDEEENYLHESDQKQLSSKDTELNSLPNNAAFWNDPCFVESWNEPQKLWPCTDTGQEIGKINENETCNKALGRSGHDCSLKRTTDHTSCSKDNPSEPAAKKCFYGDTAANRTSTKSLYKVHPRISPHLGTFSHRCKISHKVFNSMIGHSGSVNNIDWCVPQFSHLLLSASMDKSVKIWNMFGKSNSFVQSLEHHSKAVKSAYWSHNGKKILSCSYDKSAVICDVETGKEEARCSHNSFVSVGKYHTVNHNYFVTGVANELYCWDSRNTTRQVRSYTYKNDFGQVQDVTFLKDGKEFVSCSDLVCRDSADRNVMVWDFDKAAVLSNQIYQERYTCTRVKRHPVEDEFIAQTNGDYIALFSSIKPKYKMNKSKRYEGHKVVGYNIGCDFSPDGKFIVSGSSDGRVYFYDYTTSRQIHKLNLGQNTVCMDVAWHPLLYSAVAVSTWEGKIFMVQ